MVKTYVILVMLLVESAIIVVMKVVQDIVDD